MEPAKLVIEHKGPMTDAVITHEAEYDDKFNVVAFREKVNGGIHKEYSREEIEKDKYNIIKGHFLFKDPRYVLRHGIKSDISSENSLTITVFKDKAPLFGKVSVKVELLFQDDGILMTSRKYIKGNKELEDQRWIIKFRPE